MLMEKKTPVIYLLGVEFATEPDMYFSGGAPPPCFRWGPSQPGRVEVLPCAELGAWWTADEERRLGRSKEGAGFLAHAFNGEVPQVAFLVGGRQVESEPKQ